MHLARIFIVKTVGLSNILNLHDIFVGGQYRIRIEYQNILFIPFMHG